MGNGSGEQKLFEMLLSRPEHPLHGPLREQAVGNSSETTKRKVIFDFVSDDCPQHPITSLRPERVPMSPALQRSGALLIDEVRQGFVLDDLGDPSSPQREEGKISK